MTDKTVFLKDLFDIKRSPIVHTRQLQPVNEIDCYDYIDSDGNLVCKTGKIKDQTPNPKFSFVMSGIDMRFHYQATGWYGSTLDFVVIPKFTLNDQMIIFCQAMFQKVRLYLRTSAFSQIENDFNQMTVKIPFKNGHIDRSAIDQLINRIELNCVEKQKIWRNAWKQCAIDEMNGHILTPAEIEVIINRYVDSEFEYFKFADLVIKPEMTMNLLVQQITDNDLAQQYLKAKLKTAHLNYPNFKLANLPILLPVDDYHRLDFSMMADYVKMTQSRYVMQQKQALNHLIDQYQALLNHD